MSPFDALIENKRDDKVFQIQSECISLLRSLGELEHIENSEFKKSGFVWRMMVSSVHPTHWIIAVNMMDDPARMELMLLCLSRFNHTIDGANQYASDTAKRLKINGEFRFQDNELN
jgi:hypothetical protein